MPDSATQRTELALRAVIQRHWGFAELRPLQGPAMRAVLEGRDSLLVLPTGAGKSLCYQAPAVLRGDVTVVISPLIALMKDQVDRLRTCGIAAAALNSATPPEERARAERALLSGKLRLVFVSPERLANPGFLALLRRARVGALAVDEAHCISQWGHDFRPEYRQLAALRGHFPTASMHACTATATERVRRDVIEQLGLRDPEVLIGDFDRPNLTYRVARRGDALGQVQEVLTRHANEAGIVYCITRKEVDELAALLRRAGVRALPYHAGLDDEQRRGAQEAFMREECDVIVATVAFGMGIDRSNVRFVLHRGMPKSLDHYQQEAGRAGRDGLEAECVLLHADEDVGLWKFILDKARERGEASPESVAIAQQHLEEIQRFCNGTTCRHRALVEYFGQAYVARSCGACDLCLGDARIVVNSTTLAKKLLSCVARVQERCAPDHVARVLLGEWTAEIGTEGHDRLTTFGLLRDQSEAQVRDWLGQLVAQGLLEVREGALRLNESSWAVMRDQRPVKLIEPSRGRGASISLAAREGWEGVDRDLFEALRVARQQVAQERGLHPDVVFSDLTLREMARVQPGTLEALRHLYGVGEAKLREFGLPFLQAIVQHRRARQGQQAEQARRAKEEATARQREIDADAERERARGEELLRAVLGSPEEEGPRLAYADWLAERGDLLSAERAELIRAQCELARMGADDPGGARLEERAKELLRDYEMHWIGKLRQQARSWGFGRGFVERLMIESEKFLGSAEEIVGAHPIREVRLVGREWILKNVLASRHLERIVVLDLSGLSVNGGALKALVASPHLAGLRELRLAETGLDDEGARVLAGAAGLKGLGVLEVRGNELTEAGMEALRGRWGEGVRG